MRMNYNPTRSKFVSSSIGSLFTSLLTVSNVVSTDESCTASAATSVDNPRYIQSEIEMTFADNPGDNPRKRGMLVRRFTGDSTPYKFPIKPIRFVKEWPTESPFLPRDFTRMDETIDTSFYLVPRLVYHIDEPAVASLTQYYRKNIPENSSILDICSSWVSHYPMEFPSKMKRISASGMNGLELKVNDQLTDYTTRDLNVNPTLAYDDETFDVVTCVVSIDYLIQPIQVLKEVHRVLKKGGKVIISQSNRCFYTKAIKMWLDMNDRQHLELINAYFQYAGGFEEPRKAFDITAEGDGSNRFNPMFIIEAIKA